MSASGQSWKQEVSVPCVRSPVTALTRRMHPLRFAGRFGKADRLLECRLCESQNFFLFDSERGVNCVWKSWSYATASFRQAPGQGAGA